MATLKELAERTGYSPATISRILSGDPELSVSGETRRRVLEAAGAANYTATKSRRGRAPKRLLRVGVAEMLTPAEQLDDPYYLYLRNFVEQACLDGKLSALPLRRAGEGFQAPEEGELDGVVAVGIFTPAQIGALRALSGNVVFLDSSPDEANCDSVVLNYRLGIAQALDYLTGLGHTRIGFLGPEYKLDDWKRPAPEERRRHFISLLEGRGLLDRSLLVDAPMDARAAGAALGVFLASGRPRPTALLCANEECAIGAVRALGEAGLSVPGEISLVSFNDTPLSELVDPPLTSVSVPAAEMARTAVRLLCERANRGERGAVRTLPQKVVVPPALVVRGSACEKREIAP